MKFWNMFSMLIMIEVYIIIVWKYFFFSTSLSFHVWREGNAISV